MGKRSLILIVSLNLVLSMLIIENASAARAPCKSRSANRKRPSRCSQTKTPNSRNPAVKAALPLGGAPDEQPSTISPREELLAMVNQARSSARSCGSMQFPAAQPVRWDERLEASAREHSIHQTEIGDLTHVGSNNSNPMQRAQKQGLNPRSIGEAIGWNFPSSPAMLDGWLNSQEHCELVMHASFTMMGWARYGAYDTMDLST
jgi:uncharacterized protein YkwD